MNRKAVATESAPQAIGTYSQAYRVSDLLFCSGQIPLVPGTGKLIEGGFAAQARQVMKNLHAVLAAEQLDFAHVVKFTVYLHNMDDFAELNAIFLEFLSEPYPARAAVEVAGLPRDALVEIEAIAHA